jgi:hypothetical protein
MLDLIRSRTMGGMTEGSQDQTIGRDPRPRGGALLAPGSARDGRGPGCAPRGPPTGRATSEQKVNRKSLRMKPKDTA